MQIGVILVVFTGVKLIIYGTGINANAFIEKHKANCNILCCVDKHKLTGSCNGIPIKTWEDIEPGMADCLVIAATERHTREIYTRIIYDCDRNKLDIYDCRGVDLRNAYRYEYVVPEMKCSYDLNRKALLRDMIDKHDVISFDIFDTLVMRAVLEPEDVFDYVDCKLPDDSKLKGRYKAIRREIELKSKADINGVEELKKGFVFFAGLTEDEAAEVLKIEIECEKELLLVRGSVKEIFDYAIESGKKVYLISDMYYSEDILVGILNRMGIFGFEKIFVSCDYGVTKRNGLFEKYKEQVKADSYLHIGDNYEIDRESALKSRIEGFIIPSGINLLRASPFRRILYYAKGGVNRRFIGEFIACEFNDPFCLCNGGLTVPIDKPEILGIYYLAPIVYLYVKKINDLQKKIKYDKVLLGARDCYIISRVINEIDDFVKKDDYLYLYISRVLAYKLGMGNPVVDDDYRIYFEADKRRLLDEDEDFISGAEKTPYKKTKESYWKYLNSKGIERSGKYLFCDLISGGTVQHSLNVLFDKGVDGFYFSRTHSYTHRNIAFSSLYESDEYPHDQVLTDRLETFLSAPEPSVRDIDENGNFVFENETRSREELLLLQSIQNAIIEGVRKIREYETIYASEIDKKLAITLVMEIDNTSWDGELSQMKAWTATEWINGDNIGEQVKIFN